MQNLHRQIHPSDNVVVALAPLEAGAVLPLGGGAVQVCESIPWGHKVARCAIASGQRVIKYGFPIGVASTDIAPGAWVHSHNLKTALTGMAEYRYEPVAWRTEVVNDPLTFDGYLRSDGQAGVRNELWIIPTVGCVNGVAENLARHFRERPLPGSIEGVWAFQHPFGCSQLGDDHAQTRKILAALARHPNAGGVLVIGLGCENNTMREFRQSLGDADPARFRFLVTQEVEDEEKEGLRLVGELAAVSGNAKREPLPVSRLRIGLKCGGSDGFSGITANPLLGEFSDWLLARGGTTVLTEVPEMFGAEPLLLNRCANAAIFAKCAAMVNGFKQYFLRHGQPIYENPSPGNKEGGLTTLEEKSLGCTQKAGASPVVDVLSYGQRLAQAGLNLLEAPGNDMVSVTALAAAGAQIILFTTGRGTPLGGPVPTLKISSQSALALRKRNWIDFDAGPLLAGTALGELRAALTATVLQIANGRQHARNEINNCREIAIFKDGVTL